MMRKTLETNCETHYILVGFDETLWNQFVKLKVLKFIWDLLQNADRNVIDAYPDLKKFMQNYEELHNIRSWKFNDFNICLKCNENHDLICQQFLAVMKAHESEIISLVLRHNRKLIKFLSQQKESVYIASISHRSHGKQPDLMLAATGLTPLFCGLMSALIEQISAEINITLIRQTHFDCDFSGNSKIYSSLKLDILRQFISTLDLNTTAADITIVDDLSAHVIKDWCSETPCEQFLSILLEYAPKKLESISLTCLTYTGGFQKKHTAYFWLLKEQKQWKLGINVKAFKTTILDCIKKLEDTQNPAFIPYGNKIAAMLDQLTSDDAFIPMYARELTKKQKDQLRLIKYIEQLIKQFIETDWSLFANPDNLMSHNSLPHSNNESDDWSNAQSMPHSVVIILSVLIKTVLAILTVGILPIYAAFSGTDKAKATNLKLFFTNLNFFQASKEIEFQESGRSSVRQIS